jgi:hypothetical protein
VYALTGQIETSCVAGDLDQALQLTAALKSEMQRLMASAAPVLAAAERLRASVPSTAPVAELPPQAIDELSSLLRTQNLSAVDRFRSLSPQLRKLMGEACYQQIRQHVDNLQFDDAANDLDKVRGERAPTPTETH